MVQEALRDYDDLRSLRAEKAEAGTETSKSLDGVLQEIETAP